MGTMTGFNSIVGALVFLVLGILELMILQRALYPALRLRHEQAKLTQMQGMEPNKIMNVLRFQSLVIMPVLGFLLGDRLKAMIG
jgi:hypothetical protein